MTRSSLVGLIHDKILKLPNLAYENGEATSLMSNDAESLDGIAEMVHETWAQVIEVLIGIRLLATQVGWISPLPILLIYCRYFIPTLWLVTKFCSMFTYESICCETFAASSKGLEYRNTKSYSIDQLFHRFNESHQNDWTTTRYFP